MEVKPGFKQSEIGIIPSDWHLTPLSRLVRSVEYGSSAKSNSKGKVPVLRMGNLQDGKINWSDLVYTDDVAEISKYSLRSGDVLFNRTNTIDLVGKTSIYAGEQPAVFAGYLIRINVTPELLDSRFLNYVLNTEFSRKHSAKVLSVAVGQANINGQKLKTYPIPLPPTKAEQEAIAGALSDADALIESLEQLVAKKRQIKHGAMQELLTGQKRLQGFTEPWEIRSLGSEIIELQAGVSVNSDDWASGTESEVAAILKTSSVDRGRFFPWECKPISARDLRRASLNPRADTILISRMNTIELVGESGYVDANYPHLFVPDRLWMTRFRRNAAVSPKWLSYVLSTRSFREKLREIATGTSGSMKNIAKGSLLGLTVSFPSLSEQSAIATILSDMDSELDALEAKLSKARHLKQGMMQELLTGRIRLV